MEDTTNKTEDLTPYKINFGLEISVYPKTRDVYAKVYPLGGGRKTKQTKKNPKKIVREVYVQEPTQVLL